MSYTQDLLNLAMEANGIVAGITANTTAISSISVGNSTVNSSINATSLAVSGAITTGNTDLGNNQVATVAFAIAVAYTL
jgi:hypothetical protein